MKTTLFAVLFSCILRSSALAAPEIPTIVTDGMSAYQKEGPKAAMTAWLKGSPIAGDSSVGDLERTLAELEPTYGKMVGSELMHTVVFSPSSERLYFLLKFERGPGYIALDCYKSAAGWLVPIVGFNLRVEHVLPEVLFDHK